MTVLLDTSIWVDYFRGSEPAASQVAALLETETVVLCGPIIAELLAGTPVRQQEAVWLALAALPHVELDLASWRAAGAYARVLRDRGDTVPLLDLLIAVAATGAGAALWTRDTDFERVAAVVPDLVFHRAG